MDLMRLHNNVEAELQNIALSGITRDNLDSAWKLTDILKNCKKIKMMDDTPKYSQHMSSVEERKFEFINELEGIMHDASDDEKATISEYIKRVKEI